MDPKQPKGRRGPSLLVQIAVALGLVGVVPLALAVWQLVGVNREALFEQLLRTHTVAARTAADAVDSYLSSRTALAAAAAHDSRLIADPGSPEAQQLLGDSLAAWSGAGVAGLVVLDRHGAVGLQVRTRSQASIVDRMAGEALAGEATLVRLDGDLWAAVPVAVGDSGATLVLVADATPIAAALAESELGEQAKMILFHRDRRPLFGSAAGAEALPPELAEAAFSGNVSGASRYREASGREVAGAFSSAQGGRWIVVSLQPGTIAEAAARRMTRRSILAVGASLLLVAGLSVAAYSGLVRPLRALLAARRAEARDAGATEPMSSETAELRVALEELERRAHEKQALDQIFLGRYQVLERIGSGGMGSVYRGWDPRLQRKVALKTIQIEAEGASDVSASKLLAEAVAAAQINHPNVVGIFDAEERAGGAYVAMELVDGIGLDRYLEKRGRLDWREVAPLAAAMANGLAAAHAHDLVHRDIKPGNVLLDFDGDIKIADFGLATFLHKLNDAPGKVFGTPGFMAPETLQGLPLDSRSDLYAVGVVLFRALTGRYPVRGATFQQLIQATVRDPAPRPEELEGVPAEVATLVCALLEKDPERRLAPAKAVAEAFEEIVREHRLVWRLDYERSASAAPAPGALSATMPTVRLDADLA
jgi:serine/threonine-protein kinase